MQLPQIESSSVSNGDARDVEELYGADGGRDAGTSTSTVMRECSVCRLKAQQLSFITCSSCHAMIYCSDECYLSDWSDTENTHSHQHWCERMKTYMGRESALATFPFTFTTDTTSCLFDLVHYKMFLDSYGVYNIGYWRRECSLWQRGCPAPGYGDMPQVESDPFCLDDEAMILSEAPPIVISCDDQRIEDWQSYYQLRGFHLNSPVAILLSYPLTLYYILTHCLDHYPDFAMPSDELIIDLIGVEKEVELLPIFQELCYLLPWYKFDISMYGRSISRRMNSHVYEKNNLKISVHRALYHKRRETRRPHLVVGLNAGAATSRHWCGTLRLLNEWRIPAFFTDYCEYSCECVAMAVRGLFGGHISHPEICPFRSPVRIFSEECNMPSYSNAFIFSLQYEDT